MPLPPPLLAILAGLAQRGLTRDAQPVTAARKAVAGAIAAAAIGLATASARQFLRSGTTLDPRDPTQASVLVTTGVNSVTRNPMYVGLAGLLGAHAIMRGSWRALAPVGGFVALVDRLQIGPEESALLARFGDDYEAYRARVPRWLDRRSFGI
jgi:protein-S-isoprenylcysteine O-methyltransferase Ste14